jgi:hypothetical protein
MYIFREVTHTFQHDDFSKDKEIHYRRENPSLKDRHITGYTPRIVGNYLQAKEIELLIMRIGRGYLIDKS